MVIVQPTPYGADNRCTLEAARSLRGRARAVAVVGEGINEQDLRWMHSIGVRGLRINLETAGIDDPRWHAAASRRLPASPRRWAGTWRATTTRQSSLRRRKSGRASCRERGCQYV